MEKRKFSTLFDHPVSPALEFKDVSLARQEFVQECDLNKIMERYAAGLGELPHGDRQPMFGDFSNIPDYQTSLDIVIDAQEKFNALPSKVRKEFDNDPAKLLSFLSDENNRSKAIDLGLIPKPEEKPVEKPVETVSVPDVKEGEA